MMAYLAMMAVTASSNLHRVLKATGSLYLHCDPTASHYLQHCCWMRHSSPQNFLNELDLEAHERAQQRDDAAGPVHDVLALL